jgi:type IV secretion system protein VirB9
MKPLPFRAHEIIFWAFGLLFLLFSTVAYSEEIPKEGPLDARIRYVEYQADQVVTLKVAFGYTTHIQLSHSEVIENFSMGDKEAWEIGFVKNHVFLKPVGKKPDTNLTLLTQKRVYNLDLKATHSKTSKSNEMMYQVTYLFPEDEKLKKRAEQEALALEHLMNQPDDSPLFNWNYFGKGSAQVMPARAHDNGRFTFFKLPNNRDMPAVYTVNPKTKAESLVNTHIDPENPDVIIVHKVAPRFVLRKGTYVACIYNENYTLEGLVNKRATTVPGVKRVIRETANER